LKFDNAVVSPKESENHVERGTRRRAQGRWGEAKGMGRKERIGRNGEAGKHIEER